MSSKPTAGELEADALKAELLELSAQQEIELTKLVGSHHALCAKLQRYLESQVPHQGELELASSSSSCAFDSRFGGFVADGSAPGFEQPSPPADCDPVPALESESADHHTSEASADSAEIPSDVAAVRLKSTATTGTISQRLGVKEENSKLDVIVGVFILLNALVMVVELQWRGDQVAEVLELSNMEGHWMGASLWFYIMEMVFTSLFLVELVYRLYNEGRSYCKSIFNIFDAALVLVSCIDQYILAHISADEGLNNLLFFRLIRMARKMSRLVRAVRIIRTLRLFRGLRVLVHACTSFLPSLLWSMCLLSLFMSMGGIMLGSLVHDFLVDEHQDRELRLWVFQHYGTAARAIYTMYEITFAGSWPVYARPLIDEVSHWYASFFLIYVTIVVFAVIRIITAIFLREVLEAANNDADMLVQDKMHKKAGYVSKLESIFWAADLSGDGGISEDELQDILLDPKSRAYLNALDLEVHDGMSLFHLLDDGDGRITYEEFINGILRFKGPARSIDLIAMHLDIKTLREDLHDLTKLMEDSHVINHPSRHYRHHRTRDLIAFRHCGTLSFSTASPSPI